MSTILDFGIPGVSTGILHPKHKNRWRVLFSNLGGGTDSQPVSAQAVQVDRPKLSFDEIELHRYNSKAWVGGKHNWEPVKLAIEDDVTGSASTAVQAQLQAQQWLIGAEGQWLRAAQEGSLYKFSTTIEMLDGNDQVIERWTLEGCFLQNVDWDSLDYAANEKVMITMNIRFDHARQTIGGYNAGPGVATGGAGPGS